MRLAPRLLTLTSTLLAGTLIAACGGSGDADDGALEKQTLKVAALPIADNAPLFIGQQDKVFQQEGLDVEVEVLQQSSQAIPSLVRGDIDVAFGNYPSFFQAHDKGAIDLHIQSDGAQSVPDLSSVLAMPDSGIEDVEDLSGKTVAVNILNNIQELTLNPVLESNGVDSDQVTYKQVPFPNMGAALERGQVDAVWVVEPFVTDIESKLGAEKVVDPASGPTADFPLDGYFSTKKFAEDHPNTSAAFRRAMSKAQATAADRKRVEEVLVRDDFAKMDEDTAAIITLPAFPTTVKPQRLQRVADLMHQSGMLEEKLDAASLTQHGK